MISLFDGVGLFLGQGFFGAGAGIDHSASVVITTGFAHAVSHDRRAALGTLAQVDFLEGVVGTAVAFGVFVVMLNGESHNGKILK